MLSKSVNSQKQAARFGFEKMVRVLLSKLRNIVTKTFYFETPGALFCFGTGISHPDLTAGLGGNAEDLCTRLDCVLSQQCYQQAIVLFN